MRELITAKEAAKRLGLCNKTIESAVKAGKYVTETPNKRKYLVWEDGKLIETAKL